MIAWALAGLTGVIAAGLLTAGGYRADELGTSGEATSIELGVLALFLVSVIVAVSLTLIRLKGERGTVTIPSSHLLVALGGAFLGLLFVPLANIIPIGVLAYHLLRKTPVPVPA